MKQRDLNHIYAGTIVDKHDSVHLHERLGVHRDGTRRAVCTLVHNKFRDATRE